MTPELEDVWRDEWGRLLALLVGQFRRLDLAEDALADAFEAATRTWPRDGIPANPAAWLLTTARRRALDRLRAEAMAARKEPLLVVDARTQEEAQRAMADPGDGPAALTDERLRLVFLCAHPALAPEAAAALTLRLVLGVSTADLARLFLVAEPTMAARLTRARKKLAVAGVPFALPSAERLAERVDVVATVAYLAFTAGYAPGSGPDVVRTELAGEAIRLTRLLRQLLHGYAARPPAAGPLLDALLALMLLQHSRRDARVDALLAGQEPGVGVMGPEDVAGVGQGVGGGGVRRVGGGLDGAELGGVHLRDGLGRRRARREHEGSNKQRGERTPEVPRGHAPRPMMLYECSMDGSLPTWAWTYSTRALRPFTDTRR